jgi:bla regulator protein blaR1
MTMHRLTISLFAFLFAGAALADNPDFSWVLLHGGKDNSATMSGWISQVGEAKKLRKGNEALFFFRRGSSAWVIRDPATVAELEALFAPRAALGERQAKLGVKQAAIGAKQTSIGAKLEKVAVQLARARDDKTRADLEAQIDKLSQEMDELTAKQEPLSAEQEKLGAEQEALAAKAEVQLPQIVDEALANKVAIPVK